MAVVLLAFSMTGCLGGSGGFFGGGPGPRDYVSGKDYSTWIVEVDVVGNAAPPSGVLDFVKNRLQSVVTKPGGVEFRIDETAPARGGAWSDNDILQYDDHTQDLDTGGKTVVLHLLVLDGNYETNGVLGVTYSRGGATGPIAIFSQSLRDGCGPVCLGGVTVPFEAVIVHEFGHAMGLVNNGIPMVHPHEAETCDRGGGAQPDHGHSTNANSVMTCAVETNALFNLLNGNPPTDYDSNDRADLCNAGGKC